MASTVKIASSLPVALRITEPEPNPEKPGLTGPLRTAVLSGSNVAGPLGLGVTEVDKDLWSAFDKSEARTAYGDNLRVVDDGDDVPGATQFGWEPGLEAALSDKDNIKAAKQGSTFTEPGPVPAAEMKTGSNDPAPVVASPAGSDAVKAKPGK